MVGLPPSLELVVLHRHHVDECLRFASLRLLNLMVPVSVREVTERWHREAADAIRWQSRLAIEHASSQTFEVMETFVSKVS